MKLAISDRKKGSIRAIRREGGIPALVYGSGHEARSIVVKDTDFQAIMRGIKPGLLATTVFELSDGKKAFRAIIKDIQYHVVGYAVQHIDFFVLDDKVSLTVNVPVQVIGASECPGLKLGGSLRQVIRSLKVKCLPKDIPTSFELDIRDLQILQSKRLSDIQIPTGVKPLGRMNEVAVAIAKQAS